MGLQIQSWLVKLHHRKKEGVMCWIASQVNIVGNKEAYKRAKEVATSDRPEDCMHIPYTDCYRYIKKGIKERWQN